MFSNCFMLAFATVLLVAILSQADNAADNEFIMNVKDVCSKPNAAFDQDKIDSTYEKFLEIFKNGGEDFTGIIQEALDSFRNDLKAPGSKNKEVLARHTTRLCEMVNVIVEMIRLIKDSNGLKFN